MAHAKVTRAYDAIHGGVANTYTYSGSFDTFKATEVVVELDNVALTYTASTINESASPREYTVDYTNKTIHIGGANLSSGTVVIKPVTDLGSPTPRATYSPGASITSEDLNNNQKQLLRRAMEYEEQVMFKTGGTFTGTVEMGEDQVIKFEGATADAYETTLTVTDPTADRTITLPNVTGTVVTTGDTATVTATMMAANSVDSSELVDGSVDLSHMSVNSVDSDQYVDGSIDLAHMSANSVDSDQYVDGSIDLAHMSANSVDSDQYVDGSIDHVHLAADIIDGDNIQDDVINSEHIAAGAIDLEHMASSSVDSDNIVDDTIVNADINSSAAIAHSKLADVTDGQILVGSGSNKAASVAVSGDATIANTGAVTIAANAVEIGMIGCEQTTISDSDSHIPTSGAVVDYVAAQINPIGGLEVIADDESFPNTLPAAGVVISITDAAGLQINSSGVSTNGDTLDNSTVTINGFPSSLRGGVGSNADPYVLGSGAGLMVQSTGSSQTYNYHKALLKESDFVQLSDDINDFNSKYRIASSAPGSDNDEGDLYFNTSTNKMYVYDGSAWGEVTSTGDYKLLGIKDNGQAHNGTGPTFNGSNDQYDLFDGSSDASITNAGQLIVSLNGVIQKPNASYDASGEGFALDGADGIRFCDPPASGSTLFVTQIGTGTTVNVPADGSVTHTKIGAGAVTAAKVATDAVETTKIVDGNVTLAKLANQSAGYIIVGNALDRPASVAVSGDVTMSNVGAVTIASGAVEHAMLANDCVDADNIDDNAVGLAAMAHGTDGNLITYDTSGAPAHVTTGSSGQVLTSNGAGAAPTFQAAASGVTSDGNHNTLGGTNAGGNISSTVNSTAFGKDALATITGDGNNTAVGYKALEDVTGGDNTAVGASAGLQLSSGTQNTFVGKSAGENSTTGTYNTAVGHQALHDANGAANYNVAVGSWCLEELTTGDYNIGIGHDAGHKQTTGEKNVWIGNEAGYGDGASNFTAYKNVGVGAHVLMAIDGSWYNTGVGFSALKATTSGNGNTGIGGHAGLDVTTGGNNTLLGDSAGRSISPSGSVTTADNVFCLGNNSVANLYCADTSISSSDQRDKVDITDWTHGLDWINKLKPITYRWDKRAWYVTEDSDGKEVWNTPDGSKKTARLHLGFKAQDVLAVEQADGFASKKDDMLLINLNEDDTAYGMKYERLVVVLTKAVQELSAKNDALEARIATLEAG